MTKKVSLLDILEEQELVNFNNSSPITANIKNNLIPVVKELLATVPSYMPEYTLHNINHCETILDIISKILPKEIELNVVELTILIYAVYLHDIGMVVSDDDACKIRNSEEYKTHLNLFEADTSEANIFSDFIRKIHVDRSLEYIDKFNREYATYQIDFKYNGVDISDWVKNVIKSHALDIKDLNNKNKYPIDYIIGSYEVNIHYLSILLRLGDILDFDIKRTPYFLYKHINPKNETSINEWQKHFSIEGNIFNENTIKFTAKCNSSALERSVRKFLDWIEEERKNSIDSLKYSEKYYLNLINPVKSEIRNDGSYIFTDLQIELEYQKVLSILMGTELYESASVFLRELIQNSYDACEHKRTLYAKEQLNYKYYPNINIVYDSKNGKLTIEDNGIGIDELKFREYILKIGRSYYNSKSFEQDNLLFEPISHYGIGLLSCFMVSDSIEIESRRYIGNETQASPIHYKLYVNDSYIEKFYSKYSKSGTKITLQLHKDYIEKVDNKALNEIIDDLMIKHSIPINLSIDEEKFKFNNNEITIESEYYSFDGIRVIPVDKSFGIEGFIITHGYSEQGIIKNTKIAQQNFTIQNKNGGGVHFNIPWLQFSRFHINILPEKKLKLIAARNGVKDTDKNIKIVNKILCEITVDYFSQSENKKYLTKFLSNDWGSLMSGSQKELDFLIKNVPFKRFDLLNHSQEIIYFENLHFAILKEKSYKIAVIDNEHLRLENIYGVLSRYNAILLRQNIDYLIQFIEPSNYEINNFVSDIPGLVFMEIIIKNLPNRLDINKYQLNYKYDPDNMDVIYNGLKENIFCVITNNDRGTVLPILLNKNNELNKIIFKNKDKIAVNRFIESFKHNLKIAIMNNRILNHYIDYGGNAHYINELINHPSTNSREIITIEFIESVNQYLINNLFNICSDLKEEHLLDANNFPFWMIKQ